MPLTSVDFPEPETPVTEVKTPIGNETSTSRRLCSRAPTTVICLDASTGRRCSGSGDGASSGDVRPGERLLVGQEALERPGVHHLAAVLPRAGPDVDDPVRRADGVLVVLDDDERVAEVAEAGRGSR